MKRNENIKSDDATLNMLWLDVAFAKGHVDEFEAACCLAGINKENVLTDKLFYYYQKPSQIFNPRVSKIYEILLTLTTVLTRNSPFLWFIEQAVINGIPDVNYDLLLSKCKESEYRIDVIIEYYPKLAEYLNLTDKRKKGNDDLRKKILEYANEEALKLYEEKKTKKISQHDVSGPISKRLEQEKLFYSHDYVRSFLKGWVFVPPASN